MAGTMRKIVEWVDGKVNNFIGGGIIEERDEAPAEPDKKTLNALVCTETTSVTYVTATANGRFEVYVDGVLIYTNWLREGDEANVRAVFVSEDSTNNSTN